jgi:hypothetical protein
MGLAVAAVICFFAVESRTAFTVCGVAAVVLRAVQYILRLFP